MLTLTTRSVKDWKIGVENSKYGPMGEDLFVEMCMRKNGVTGTKVEMSHALATVKV